ncbi:MAG: hypothetical protein CVV06_08985 [Gammaproteobacteria bacterium HGW-Gammaproteobacteria-10]|nr:MAG: hypothetical protein CVV06_08985 [Gammaproteobacteria bacterium HGW-Gammaproteobacteria-10]
MDSYRAHYRRSFGLLQTRDLGHALLSLLGFPMAYQITFNRGECLLSLINGDAQNLGVARGHDLLLK